MPRWMSRISFLKIFISAERQMKTMKRSLRFSSPAIFFPFIQSLKRFGSIVLNLISFIIICVISTRIAQHLKHLNGQAGIRFFTLRQSSITANILLTLQHIEMTTRQRRKMKVKSLCIIKPYFHMQTEEPRQAFINSCTILISYIRILVKGNSMI